MPLKLLEGTLLADQLARCGPFTGYWGIGLALATLGADLQLVESDLKFLDSTSLCARLAVSTDGHFSRHLLITLFRIVILHQALCRNDDRLDYAVFQRLITRGRLEAGIDLPQLRTNKSLAEVKVALEAAVLLVRFLRAFFK